MREQERELGPLLFRQEYGCAFVDDAEALFSSELVAAAIDPGCCRCSGWRMRRDAGCTYPRHWTMGVDLGQAHDPTAIAVVETVLTVRWWDDDGELRSGGAGAGGAPGAAPGAAAVAAGVSRCRCAHVRGLLRAPELRGASW